METQIIETAPGEGLDDSLQGAAKLIHQGEVVAFPTETVYGLGANALNPSAVQQIFKAKGRPGDNPLIVHIVDKAELDMLTADIPGAAYPLMDAFWPGPLTLILKKSHHVPSMVTAGLETVALRIPSHPIAAALLRISGVPIAAPSANRSGRPSPTTASHVFADMKGRIPMIIDGGRAAVGLESTVLDLSGDKPVLLRPGGVTLEMLREVLGHIEIDRGISEPIAEGQPVKSPGMKYTHYAPNAPVIIYRGSMNKQMDHIKRTAADYREMGKTVGILATDETQDSYAYKMVLSLGSREEPAVMAANLFSCLRDFDELQVDIILAEGIDPRNEGMAVMNRMARAAGFHIIDL